MDIKKQIEEVISHWLNPKVSMGRNGRGTIFAELYPVVAGDFEKVKIVMANRRNELEGSVPVEVTDEYINGKLSKMAFDFVIEGYRR